MAYLRAFLLVLILTSNAFADWYILLPKKRHSKREIPKKTPSQKNKKKKIQPKPYSIEVNKILAPNFSIPLISKKISKEYFSGKNVIIIFVDNLFSPFTESIATRLEKLNLKDTEIVIISINDSDFVSVEIFRKLLHLRKIIVSADSYIFKEFKAKISKLSVPSVIIIDKSGFIRFFSSNIQNKTANKLSIELKELISLINKK